jgi:hypothetical protein
MHAVLVNTMQMQQEIEASSISVVPENCIRLLRHRRLYGRLAHHAQADQTSIQRD